MRPEWSVAGACGSRIVVRSLVNSCRRESGFEAVFPDGTAAFAPLAALRSLEERTGSPSDPAPAIPGWLKTLLKVAASPAAPEPDRALLLVIAAVERDSPSDEAALALAGALSLSERRTILLDLETPDARLSTRLDLRAAPGMADLLSGEILFDAAIRRLRGSRLHVIPAGLSGEPPAQTDVESVFDALAETYDAVVLHVGASDEPRFASWPGAALALVMRPASASSG